MLYLYGYIVYNNMREITNFSQISDFPEIINCPLRWSSLYLSPYRTPFTPVRTVLPLPQSVPYFLYSSPYSILFPPVRTVLPLPQPVPYSPYSSSYSTPISQVGTVLPLPHSLPYFLYPRQRG